MMAIPSPTAQQAANAGVNIPTTPPRFAVRDESALMALPPLKYLDRYRCIIAQSFHLVYGASGSGKTFWVVDCAMSLVADGLHVLYIATEDLINLRYYVASWRMAHPNATGILTWLEMQEGIDLQDPGQVVDLLDTIDPCKFDCIVIDTLREAHTGDENSSQDTACVNRAIQRLVSL